MAQERRSTEGGRFEVEGLYTKFRDESVDRRDSECK